MVLAAAKAREMDLMQAAARGSMAGAGASARAVWEARRSSGHGAAGKGGPMFTAAEAPDFALAERKGTKEGHAFADRHLGSALEVPPSPARGGVLVDEYLWRGQRGGKVGGGPQGPQEGLGVSAL